MQVTVVLELSDELLQDVVDVAQEGAIAYWAYHSGKDEWTENETSSDHEPSKEFVIDSQLIATGIQRVLSTGFKVRDDIRSWITEGIASNDAGDIDADCADAIVQAAVFGKLVYG